MESAPKQIVEQVWLRVGDEKYEALIQLGEGYADHYAMHISLVLDLVKDRKVKGIKKHWRNILPSHRNR